MAEIHIDYRKGKITINTDTTRVETFERIVLQLGTLLIDKGQKESMQSIIDIFQDRLDTS